MSPKPLQSNWPVKTKSIDCAAIKKAGWHENGILVVDRNDGNLSWDIRHMIDAVGNALYGERKCKALEKPSE